MIDIQWNIGLLGGGATPSCIGYLAIKAKKVNNFEVVDKLDAVLEVIDGQVIL